VRCSKAGASNKKQKDCSFHDRFSQLNRRHTLFFRFPTVSAFTTPAPAPQRRNTQQQLLYTHTLWQRAAIPPAKQHILLKFTTQKVNSLKHSTPNGRQRLDAQNF
jgi:hypothetical protein